MAARYRALFLSMSAWAGLGAALAIASCWAVRASDGLLLAVLGWFAGGIAGALWVTDTGARRAVVSGYFVGLVLNGLVTKALPAFLAHSLHHERLIISVVYLSTPLIGAAIGLAFASPDPAVALGFERDPDGLGRVRATWKLALWPAGPLLACIVVGFRLMQGPVDFAGHLYGPGSKSCRKDSDCFVEGGCNHCGGCYSESPNEPFECEAICSPEELERTTCICQNGYCEPIRRAN